MATVTLQGNAFDTQGELPKAGSQAPAFNIVTPTNGAQICQMVAAGYAPFQELDKKLSKKFYKTVACLI